MISSTAWWLGWLLVRFTRRLLGRGPPLCLGRLDSAN
ncbi:hypothetical protein CASFOL_019807 [Castilleja foliolosa]|uniref:Uncharacterized protein n=1 Tax=Castilleja foliolosa TaxID=1961234 RepID=A0ABD3D2T4_9LAMI